MPARTLDFAAETDWLIAFLPEVALALTALAILLADVFARRGDDRPSADWVGPAAVVGTLVAAAAYGYLLTVETADPAPLVAVDGFRVAAGWIILGATLVGLLFARDYLEREGLRVGEFYVLVLLASVGMMVLVGARDLILVFLGLELMSIAIYVLTGFDRRSPRGAEASLKYFLIGAFASAFLLYGIALLYGATGSTNLGRVAAEVATAADQGDLLLLAGLGLLVIGFGFKVSAVPFHMWTPDAYEGAPTPVTGYMAAGVKVAAFVALLRILVVDLAPAAFAWQTLLWWLAMLTMIVPNLVALVQDNVKRMLAYSSVAHAGYILVGVVAGNALGLAAALFYLAVYALMTLGAFAVIYHVAGPGDRRSRLADYRGLGWSRPAVGLAMLVFMLSLAGFPPTGGFVAKLFLLRAAVDAGEIVLAVTLVVTSLVAYYYYFRVVWKMYFDEAPEEAPLPAMPGAGFRVATVVCVAGVLVGGVAPGPAIERFERAGAALGPAVTALEGEAGAAAREGEVRAPAGETERDDRSDETTAEGP